MNRRPLLGCLPLALALLLGACATPPSQGLIVSVAQVEVLPSAGSELRATVTLRLQNPNDSAVKFSGATVELGLRGQTIGSGVSSAGGRVPRLGETTLPVVVTVTQVNAVKQALGLYGSDDRRLSYRITGTLSAAGMLKERLAFESVVELAFPGASRL